MPACTTLPPLPSVMTSSPDAVVTVNAFANPFASTVIVSAPTRLASMVFKPDAVALAAKTTLWALSAASTSSCKTSMPLTCARSASTTDASVLTARVSASAWAPPLMTNVAPSKASLTLMRSSPPALVTC